MRVLQINSVCGIGSTGRIAIDLNKALTEAGHESYIAYGRDNVRNTSNKVIKIGSKIDNYLHVAKTRLFDKHGLGSIKATKEFIESMEQINPDIIHLHNIHGYYLNVELLFEYIKKVNKPIVWTLHDCWPFTGHCAHFDNINCNKWKTGCYSCPHKRGYPGSILIDNSKENYEIKRKLFTGVDNLTIVTPSNWLAGLVNLSFLQEYPLKVINNGINLNVFKPITSNFRERYNLQDKFIILGVANIWGRGKGYEYFIELAKRISSDEIIVMVGLSEKQIKSLPVNIIGIKKTNSIKELAEIYSASDVFINPTLDDNFPTTNLEALACGTPVITFNTGGSPESIDLSCGMVVEKGNIAELMTAIKIYKEKDRIICVNNCLSRSKLYDKEVKYNEYLVLYESLIASRMVDYDEKSFVLNL